MKLYISSVSPMSVMVQLALAAKELNHDVINLTTDNVKVPEQIKDLPALVFDNLYLSQPLAIVEFLEDSGQGTPLFPSDVPLRAAVRSFIYVIARDLMHWEHNLSSRYMETELGMDETNRTDWLLLCMKEGFSKLEHMLATQARTGTYCFGEQLTLADLALLPQVIFARQAGLTMGAYPHIERICDNCLELEWCRSLLTDL